MATGSQAWRLSPRLRSKLLLKSKGDQGGLVLGGGSRNQWILGLESPGRRREVTNHEAKNPVTLTRHVSFPGSRFDYCLDACARPTPRPPRSTVTSGAFSGTTNPPTWAPAGSEDRKSTRLNSSHSSISYAVFC